MRIGFMAERAFGYFTDLKVYRNIDQIKRDAYYAGSHFFDKGTMRSFKSRVYDEIYHYGDGKNYFITSERFNNDSPRLYTLRQYLHEGEIKTIGEFQQYTSLRAVRKAILSGKAFESEVK